MKSIISTLLLLSAVSVLQAEGEPATGPQESELMNWMMATRHQQSNPQAAFDLDLREKEIQVERGIPYENPELRFTYGEDRNATDGQNQNVSALRFPLPHPWIRRAEKAGNLADLHLEQASASENQLERDWDCLQTGANLQYLQADHQLLLQKILLQESAVLLAQSFVNEGAITRPAVTRLKLGLLSTRQTLSRNRLDFHDERRRLSLLTSLAANELQANPTVLDPASLIRRFPLENNLASPTASPILNAWQEQLEAQKAEAKANRIPWFEHIQARVESEDGWGNADSADVQVAISIPVFSWFDDGVRLADETLTIMDAYQTNLLDQEAREQKDRIEELQAALPELEKEYIAFQKLQAELHNLRQLPLPVKEKMDVDAMAIQLIDLQRKLLSQQQRLELRLWHLSLDELRDL